MKECPSYPKSTIGRSEMKRVLIRYLNAFVNLSMLRSSRRGSPVGGGANRSILRLLGPHVDDVHQL